MIGNCKRCKHFENEDFDNKNYGYCQKLYQEIYSEDKNGNVIDDENVVTNANFGCIRFEESGIVNNEN